jgi:hypothetical protein
MKSITLKNSNLTNALPNYETKLDFEGGVSRQMLSCTRRLTIRLGKRYFQRSIKIHGYDAIVENVKHTSLLHLDFITLSQQGFTNMFKTLLILKRFYPKIDVNTPISVVEYRILPY